MERHSGLLIFDSTLGGRTVRTIYSLQHAQILRDFDSMLADVCDTMPQPDEVVLVASDSAPNERVITFNSAEFSPTLDRIRGRMGLTYTAISPSTAKVSTHSIVPGKITTAVQNKFKSFDWITWGLNHVFTKTTTLLTAPPGYKYEKPSGESSTIFLKPDLALVTSAAVSFVATALIFKLFSQGKNKPNKIRTIFVDTMAISPVAFAIKEMMTNLGNINDITIESFHSYGGFERVRRPMPNESLCIISASSSMSMHNRWISEKRVPPEDVVTLLTLSDANNPGRALVSIPSPLVAEKATEPHRSILIAGESFYPAQESTKKVLLTALDHGKASSIATINKLATAGVFDSFRATKARPNKPRAIYVDGEKLIETTLFSLWIKPTLVHKLRANTKHIIYQDDTASRSMATMIAAMCKEICGIEPDIHPDTEDFDRLDLNNASLIVCAAVCSKGSRLLQISRLLRDVHDGPRIYVIGYQIAESSADISSLYKNLRFRERFNYDVEVFASAATGQTLAQSLQDEASFWMKNPAPSSMPAVLKQRATRIGATTPVGPATLLPSGPRLATKMPLRRSFAFWDANYIPGPLQPEVLATIAVILQRAREDSSLKDDCRLSSDRFRHIVLDPSNFSRFNDGAIQAALLRCAQPSEIDYRSDLSSSDFMRHIIIRTVQNCEEESGEACLEFILALGTGRLRLSAPHWQDVKREIENMKPSARKKVISHLAFGSQMAGQVLF